MQRNMLQKRVTQLQEQLAKAQAQLQQSGSPPSDQHNAGGQAQPATSDAQPNDALEPAISASMHNATASQLSDQLAELSQRKAERARNSQQLGSAAQLPDTQHKDETDAKIVDDANAHGDDEDEQLERETEKLTEQMWPQLQLSQTMQEPTHQVTMQSRAINYPVRPWHCGGINDMLYCLPVFVSCRQRRLSVA